MTPQPTPDRRLHKAAANGRIDEVKELIAAGLDVNAQDEQGCTPLHCAAPYPEIFIELICAGARTDLRDCLNMTPRLELMRRHWPKHKPRIILQEAYSLRHRRLASARLARTIEAAFNRSE